MLEPRPDESRVQYLVRVLHKFMEENPHAAECTIDYDGTTCDGACLAEDFVNEVEAEIEQEKDNA